MDEAQLVLLHFFAISLLDQLQFQAQCWMNNMLYAPPRHAAFFFTCSTCCLKLDGSIFYLLLDPWRWIMASPLQAECGKLVGLSCCTHPLMPTWSSPCTKWSFVLQPLAGPYESSIWPTASFFWWMNGLSTCCSPKPIRDSTCSSYFASSCWTLMDVINEAYIMKVGRQAVAVCICCCSKAVTCKAAGQAMCCNFFSNYTSKMNRPLGPNCFNHKSFFFLHRGCKQFIQHIFFIFKTK